MTYQSRCPPCVGSLSQDALILWCLHTKICFHVLEAVTRKEGELVSWPPGTKCFGLKLTQIPVIAFCWPYLANIDNHIQLQGGRETQSSVYLEMLVIIYIVYRTAWHGALESWISSQTHIVWVHALTLTWTSHSISLSLFSSLCVKWRQHPFFLLRFKWSNVIPSVLITVSISY